MSTCPQAPVDPNCTCPSTQDKVKTTVKHGTDSINVYLCCGEGSSYNTDCTKAGWSPLIPLSSPLTPPNSPIIPLSPTPDYSPIIPLPSPSSKNTIIIASIVGGIVGLILIIMIIIIVKLARK